ncbi:probable pectinesterase/pectinesterase inhibitor 58 [Lycium barbarum]|uniref:probable pectinesterase/pectinesterase inhibitor 58 n=1 Tax=Lycium barbarum TaxID=112863 RepID=UPI00293E3602|nr:probable pectinesterase/pectinesterase inhibitor 58 [Lycium barbarum]
MGENHKRNIALVSLCSLLVVAMVVALSISRDKVPVAVSVSHREVTLSSIKAITSVCQSTSYQETCIDSLTSLAGKSSQGAKDLVRAAFQATIKHIKEAATKTSAWQTLEKDPRTRMALENCEELADRAIYDLNRSYSKFGVFDIKHIGHWVTDMQIWLSGAVTYQETCLDGFEDTSGDAGKKMRMALNASMKLTSNALSMITKLSSLFPTLNVNRRHLLFHDAHVLGHGNELLPDWIDAGRRRHLSSKPTEIKPDLIVAKDSTGKYKTITEALKDIPKNSNQTFVLYIKEGVYDEQVQFNQSLVHLMVIGDGPTKTRITGKLNFIDGVPTYHTATVAVNGDYFMAKDIGFENTAGPEKHQAVALRVGADKSIFYNCHMDGYQDTLYAHTYRQFYSDCVISGTIDFIFGDSAAVFQNCTLVVQKPMDNQQCIVTAQGRKDPRQPTGFVLQNCKFVADNNVDNKTKSYLGRPWKEYSRTIIMESSIEDFIQLEGWLLWNDTFALNTLFYVEFNNRGPASSKTQRVKWEGVKELPASRIERFTTSKFIDGDSWIPSTGIPYSSGFFFPPPKEDASIKYSPEDPIESQDLERINKDKSSYHHLTSDIAPVLSPLEAPPARTTSVAPTTSPVSAKRHRRWPFSFFSGA